MKKFLLLIVVLTVAVAFSYFDLGQVLNLENLKGQQEAINTQYNSSPLLVITMFFAIYVVATAVSFPGAVILTLAAGAIFGIWVGTVIVSFASAIGATLAFLASRYLLRDWVHSRFGIRMKVLNDGMIRDGAFYLFTLRLVPVFPFFLVNLLTGLTPIRTWTYYWVSQVGMLLGTIVYVNAGTQIAKVNALGDILSPGVLLSFAVLGFTPWIGKWVMNFIKSRRSYMRWVKPKQFDRNLVVIGAGSAGLVSAYIAATVKAKVTLVEAHKMGGDCLNFGCVPSKALIKSAKLAYQMRHGDKYGLTAHVAEFGFKAVMQRVHDVIAAIEPHDSVERFTNLGVDVVNGYARIVDPWTIEIRLSDGKTQRLTTRSIIIATGAEPFVPPLSGLDETGYFTSDTLWDEFVKLDKIPERIVVLGGGPIGCELSQAFARLGSKVSQVEMLPRLLMREDPDVAEIAKTALEESGVTVLTGYKALRCEVVQGEKQIIVEFAGEERAIPFDALIVAVGRKARLSGYGLEDLGVDTDKTVVTDEYLATIYPNIYAAGDVAGPYQFTHTAAHQAWFASVNALFGQLKKFKADYRVIPWVTFTDPEIARVGLNETDAKEKGILYETTFFPMHELDRAITDSETQGFVKVLTPSGKDEILGVTIIGNNAGELLAEYVLAMKYGLGLNKILATIHSYPTMVEANRYVAGEWKRKHTPHALLKWVERYHQWRRH